MNRILVLLGASKLGITNGIKLGFKVIIISDRDKYISSEITKLVEEIYFVKSLDNEGEVFQKVRHIMNLYKRIDLILSFTELGLRTASYISYELNLPTNPTKIIDYTRNKALMREKFLKNDVLKLDYNVGYIHEFKVDKLPMCLPFIVKPLDGFGSKNVFLINHIDEWKEWYVKGNRDYPNIKWILEPFIEGPEYSVETVSSNGNHFILGVTKKETTGSPNFIEIGHSVPGITSWDFYKKALDITETSLNVMGIQYGPGHIEIKWDNKESKFVIIEMHTRPGGDYIPYLHTLSSGIDQYEMGIRSYYDSSVLETTLPTSKKHSMVKFLTFPEGVLLGKGFVNEKKDVGIKDWDIYYKIGDRIIKTIDSYSRAGHIIVSTDSKQNSANLLQAFEENLIVKIGSSSKSNADIEE
ncbi:ATP-grasp domain-containing protein [Cerasibacillus sp. JNUCC 74]